MPVEGQRDLLRTVGGRRSDGDGAGGAERSGQAQGRVLRLIQRSRQPFLADAEGGRSGGPPPSHAGGTGDAGLGSAYDSSLLAAGAGTERTQLRSEERRVGKEGRSRRWP